MSDLWEQQDDEPSDWYDRFARYLHLGPQRKLMEAYRQECLDRNLPVPTYPSGAWRRAETEWQWKKRADAYDKHMIAQARAAYDAQRHEILSTGLALQHERVQLLKDMASQLNSFRNNPDLLWLKQSKQVGGGRNTQIIEETVFNAPIVRELRGVLDDIAKEVGGRVAKTELTGKDGTALQVHLTLPETENTSGSALSVVEDAGESSPLASVPLAEVVLPETEGGAA